MPGMAADTVKKPARRLLDLHTVAEELSCSFDTVDRLLRHGELAFIRLPSGRRRISREALDSAIARWTVESR
jgi:excisionase family DNA binding protein